ncbi:hypothetical protein, partial [Proteus mirabilis]|uniref:hypothetical protein n=1 Tax=Proteus mirabilis TaxID=584 RepID=UPI0034D6F617
NKGEIIHKLENCQHIIFTHLSVFPLIIISLLSGASSENFCHLTIRFILFLLLVFSTDFDACLFEIALSTIAYKV